MGRLLGGRHEDLRESARQAPRRPVVASPSPCGIAWCAPSRRRAQSGEIVIGLYAPSAPFTGPAQRLEFVRALADHVSAQTGRRVVGRVFAAGSSLSAAIKGGEVQFAVIDAPYGAAIGLPYDILGAAVRGDSRSRPGAWCRLRRALARPISRARRSPCPAVGARDGLFVANGLLEGEVDPSFFGKIATAPDAQSAVTMVGVGRAQAASFPVGIDLPAGVRLAGHLNAIGWPMFVAAPGVDRATADSVGRAVRGFRAAARSPASPPATPGATARSTSGASRKARMAVPPPARLNVRDILEGRSSRSTCRTCSPWSPRRTDRPTGLTSPAAASAAPRARSCETRTPCAAGCRPPGATIHR